METPALSKAALHLFLKTHKQEAIENLEKSLENRNQQTSDEIETELWKRNKFARVVFQSWERGAELMRIYRSWVFVFACLFFVIILKERAPDTDAVGDFETC